MRHRPQRAKPTEVIEWNAGRARPRTDDLVTEEPLEIRVNGEAVSVTMRTPGDDFDLAAGFLFTEGVLERREALESLAFGPGKDGQVSANVIDARLHPTARFDVGSLQRQFIAASGCGICGKTSIESIRARDLHRLDSDLCVDGAILTTLPGALRTAQTIFDRTGALHAAALFSTEGSLVLAREDVGRHNAVDKIIGAAFLGDRLPLSRSMLLISGRGGFEIIQKAVCAGIPVVASVSAPSSLAVQCAREFGLTLVGFLRGDRFVIYAGERRITR